MKKMPTKPAQLAALLVFGEILEGLFMQRNQLNPQILALVRII